MSSSSSSSSPPLAPAVLPLNVASADAARIRPAMEQTAASPSAPPPTISQATCTATQVQNSLPSPTTPAYPPPRATADAVAAALHAAYKVTLEEVDSYLAALEARVRCEEDYLRSLRASIDKTRDYELRLDSKIGSVASNLPGATNLPPMRRAWRELLEDTQRQIEVRSNFVQVLKTHTIAPLRAFHDAQERIRRRVKDDVKSSLGDYDDMRHTQLRRIRRNYERACEAVESLKAQQQAAEDQKTLLMSVSPSSKTSDLARSPPLPSHAFASMGGSEDSSRSDGLVRDTAGLKVSGGSSPASPPQRSRSFGRYKAQQHLHSRPPSAGSSRPSRDLGDVPRSSMEQVDVSVSPPSSDGAGAKKNVFEVLRSRETWDTARKDVAKKTNALLTKMKEGHAAGSGGALSAGAGAPMDRDAGSSGGGLFGGGDSGANPTGLVGGLHHSASMSSRHAQFAQNMAVKLSKAKRESQEADKAYRRAIFDVETLALRREKTLSAARASILGCRRELSEVCSQAWLSIAHNWQVLSNTELSLARHFESAIQELGSPERLTSEISMLEGRLPVLGGNKGTDDGPVPYVNFWHGECKSLLFGISLLDYDFARNQRRPPLLGPAPVEPPLIVSKCISFIEEHALDTPGIYRTSAKHTAVQQLCAAFETDEERFQFDAQQDDHAAVAGVLKQWLRELPQSVMPMPWEERLKLTHSVDEQLSNGFAALKGRIRRLPPINQVTLKAIIQHLALIAAHSATNLMTAKNLSVVFGPVLLSDAAENSHETTSLAAAMEEDNVCEILINHAEDIFSLERAGAPVLPPLALEADARRERKGHRNGEVGSPYSSSTPVTPISPSPSTAASDRPLVPPSTSTGLKRSNAVTMTPAVVTSDGAGTGPAPELGLAGDGIVTSEKQDWGQDVLEATGVTRDDTSDSVPTTTTSAGEGVREEDAATAAAVVGSPPPPAPLDLPMPKLDVEMQGKVL